MGDIPEAESALVFVEEDPFRGQCEQIESLAELISAYIFGAEVVGFKTEPTDPAAVELIR